MASVTRSGHRPLRLSLSLWSSSIGRGVGVCASGVYVCVYVCMYVCVYTDANYFVCGCVCMYVW